MPDPVRIKYGPSPYVFMDNPEWGEERDRDTPSDVKQMMYKPYDGFTEQNPSIKQVDLYHLSQQLFTQNTPALKRWFLTALVLEEDVPLLNPPESQEDQKSIQQQISAINDVLNKKSDDATQTDLDDLKIKLCNLFKTKQWIGVGLQLVDNNTLSIDVLNSLIFWQASIIQLGEKAFKLYKISDETPLKTNGKTFTLPGISNSSLHQNIFAEAALTLDDVRKTRWGIIYELDLRLHKNYPPEWQPSIDDFHTNLAYYHWVDENTSLLHSHFPSTLLHERALIDNKQRAIPVFAFGYLYYEDFNAASYLTARFIQAYLPGAKGNLYHAHGEYLGEALISMHDLFHTSLPPYYALDASAMTKQMKISSIVGNAYVQEKGVKYANGIIDNSHGSILSNYINQRIFLMHPFKQQEDFLIIIYTELALAAGITSKEITCTKEFEFENDFTMHVTLKSHTVTLPLTLIAGNNWVTSFYEHFEKLKRLRETQTSLVTTVYTPANGTVRSPAPDGNRLFNSCSIL